MGPSQQPEQRVGGQYEDAEGVGGGGLLKECCLKSCGARSAGASCPSDVRLRRVSAGRGLRAWVEEAVVLLVNVHVYADRHRVQLASDAEN